MTMTMNMTSYNCRWNYLGLLGLLLTSPVPSTLADSLLVDLVELRAKGAGDDPVKQFLLGRAYLKGEDGPKNATLAHQLLKSAAEANHAEAMGAYGYLLSRGIGTEQDDNAAVSWMRRSVAAGQVPFSLLNLGIMTFKGRGTERNVDVGLELMGQAAGKKSIEAMTRLAEIYYFGEDGVFLDYAKASQWAEMAAAEGNAWAQNLMGTMKEHGLGQPLDGAGAVEFYRKSAAQGNAKAQGNLGRCLFNGLHTGRDPVDGLYWLKASAGQAEITARRFLDEIEAGITAEQSRAVEEKLKVNPPPRAKANGASGKS